MIHSAVSPALVREFLLTTPDPSSGRPAHVGYLLQADDTIWTSTFANGTRVDLGGSLTVHFVVTLNGLKIESIEFNSRGHDKFVGRDSIATERVERIYERRVDDEERERFEREEEERQREEDGEGRKRQKEKAKKPGASTRRRSATRDSEDAAEDLKDRRPCPGSHLEQLAPGLSTVRFDKHMLPVSPVGSFGITEMGMRCLEVRSLLPFFATFSPDPILSHADRRVGRAAAGPHRLLARPQPRSDPFVSNPTRPVPVPTLNL